MSLIGEEMKEERMRAPLGRWTVCMGRDSMVSTPNGRPATQPLLKALSIAQTG